MPSRVFALLVAMVLLLSGWTTPAAAAAFAPVGLEQASELAQRCADGPAGDVVADGQQAPEQANPETSGDLPALIAAGPEARPPALKMTMPRPYAMVEMISPYLDGLRRPPRATLLVA